MASHIPPHSPQGDGDIPPHSPPGDGGPLVSRLMVLAAAFLFSTGGVVVKSCGLGPWQIASFRCLVAAVTLLIVLPGVRRRPSWPILGVGTCYAGMTICYVFANKATTAASAIFLQATAPLYVLLLAPVLLGERGRLRDLAVMAGLAGGLALLFLDKQAASASAPDPFRGNVLGALTGLCWAGTVMGLRFLGRKGRAGNEGALAVVWGNVVAGLACLPMALPVTSEAAGDYLWVAYLGVFQIAAAYLFLTSAMGSVPALDASLLLLVEPVINPVWAFLFLGEAAGRWTLAGAALILAMTALQSWWAENPAVTHPPPWKEHDA